MSNGLLDGGEIEVSPAIFSELGDLEKEFASVELDALRRKEYALTDLYARRSTILQSIPGFWPQVLFNGPQEFQSVLSLSDAGETDNLDVQTISAIKNLTVERHTIKSPTEGEPRSFRITFEFGKNDIFEDTKVTKEFDFVSHEGDDSGSLVSKPVSFKWTKKGKKLIQNKTGGLLDLAVDLYKAEEAAKINLKKEDGKKGGEIDMVEREELWQYEKLRQKIEEVEAEDAEFEGCWLEWFGYRGPVDMPQGKSSCSCKAKSKTNGEKEKNGDAVKSADEDEDQFADFDEDDNCEDVPELLDVEIFPTGEEVALCLVDDLWANVMDYFMQSQDSDEEDIDAMEFDEGESDDDEEAPELVEAEEIIVEDIASNRPSKKQRMK